MTRREEAAAAYADHLIGGGTATWAQWWAGGGSSAHPPGSARLPVLDLQLEVLRRLSMLGAPGPAGLAELVLGTPAAGRGRPEAPPCWPPDSAAGPERLPAGELLRVCTPVLVRLLEQLDRRRDEAPARGVGPISWLRGRRRTRPRRVHAGPLEAMMARAWQQRVAAGGTVGWVRLWRRAVRRDALPRAADPGRLAAELAAAPAAAPAAGWAGRGHRPVEVVVSDELAAASGPVDLVGTDLCRRVNLVLHHHDLPSSRAAELLRPHLGPGRPPRGAYAAPAFARDWARHAARRVVASLVEDAGSAGYAVRGDVDVVLRRLRAPDRPDPEETLDLALRACGSAWQEVRR